MQDYLSILLLVTVSSIAITGFARFTVAIFSQTVRRRITARPILHGIWFLLTIGSIALAILPAFFFPPCGRSGNRARSIKAKNDLGNLTFALKLYQNDEGKMPSGENAQIMTALSPYLNFPRTRFNQTGELLDPWQTPYRIDTSNPDFPWAYSFGPNKRDDGGVINSDDIVSWPLYTPPENGRRRLK